jgi:predicted nucleic acid-binding protein
LKVFLDTSILSDEKRDSTRAEMLKASDTGLQLYVLAVSHFQILWGHATVQMSPTNYHKFLEVAGVEVAPLIRADVEEAAKMKPSRADILDAPIASTARRYGAVVWTGDKDFLKLLSKSKVRVVHDVVRFRVCT